MVSKTLIVIGLGTNTFVFLDLQRSQLMAVRLTLDFLVTLELRVDMMSYGTVAWLRDSEQR